MKKYIIICLLFCVFNCRASYDVNVPGNFKNPQAVKDVLTGVRKIANATWWGFDVNDSTAALQGVINSGAKKIVIPYMGSDWITKPIQLQSNQEIYFEPGVVVIAKKGEFKGKNDCLFSAIGKNNITLTGYGATLSMQKADYTGGDYVKSEFRHLLSFRNCNNIKVLGLTLKDSGGDGIFVGTQWTNRRTCRNILIKDCICDNNYRQGISITSAENLLIENCILKNTNGTGPSAGIDLEPSFPEEKMVNVVVNNGISENNNGPGFLVYLGKLSKKSEDVSILFVNCHVKGGRGTGIHIGPARDEGPKGLVEFRNCTIEDIDYSGTYIYDKSSTGPLLRFSNCKWYNVGVKGVYPKSQTSIPFYFLSRDKSITKKLGGVEFTDCYVYDEKNRPIMLFEELNGICGIFNIKGTINVESTFTPKVDLGSKTGDIELKINKLSQSKHSEVPDLPDPKMRGDTP